MTTPIQRSMPWLGRLLFFGTQSPLHGYSPIVVPTIDAGVNWPRNQQIKYIGFSSVAGLVTTENGPPAGKHWMVHAHQTAGIFAVDDTFVLKLVLRDFAVTGVQHYLDIMPLVTVAGLALRTSISPAGPLYVPYPYAFRCEYTSTAGGVGIAQSIIYEELSDYEPF